MMDCRSEGEYRRKKTPVTDNKESLNCTIMLRVKRRNEGIERKDRNEGWN
jgi:hypothetical protein